MRPTHSLWLEDTIAGLRCRVLLPERYRPQEESVPLVVSLHGSGERGEDNWSQLRNGLAVFEPMRRHRKLVVVAPQLPRGETWGGSWYGGESEGQKKLVSLVRELKSRRSVDTTRVYGVGFSMGAIGLWDILVRHEGLFCAAVLIAGDLDVQRSEKLAHFPLWAIHGGRDDLVVPDNTRAFARLVEEQKGIARYTEVGDAGHDVWHTAFRHGPLWDWLFAQQRA